MKMLIDSHWVESASEQSFEVFNPATGATIDRVPQATIEDAQLALDAAQRGKENMKKLPAHERSAILDRVARAMAAQSRLPFLMWADINLLSPAQYLEVVRKLMKLKAIHFAYKYI